MTMKRSPDDTIHWDEGGEPAGDAAHKLLNLMQGISEHVWCAGWVGGLEFKLWAFVSGDRTDLDVGLSSRDIAKLRSLAAHAWWVNADYLPDAPCGPHEVRNSCTWDCREFAKPVPMADWLLIYAKGDAYWLEQEALRARQASHRRWRRPEPVAAEVVQPTHSHRSSTKPAALRHQRKAP